MARDVPVNPFRFGPLALDEAFTDRQDEIGSLVADARNGQDVVVFAPRRYGKSSLDLARSAGAGRARACSWRRWT